MPRIHFLNRWCLIRRRTLKCCILLLLIPLVIWASLVPIVWLPTRFYRQYASMPESKTTGQVSTVTQPQWKLNDTEIQNLTQAQQELNETKLQTLLRHLNLSESQRLSHLPLTLQGPDFISNDSICVTDDESPVDVLFIVHTAPWHFSRRLQMRRTFLSEAQFKPYKVRTVFLLGTVENTTLQDSLEREHAQHGDLLQGNFNDSYHNLSHKGVLGFRWITHHCARAGLVVKLDDDVFFDTFMLLHRYMAMIRGKKRSIFGNVFSDARIFREGKHQTHLLPNATVYPWVYANGMTVIITTDLVLLLFEAATFSPVFWIDDIYLYGILPFIVTGVDYYNVGYSTGVLSESPAESLKCMETNALTCPLLATLANEEEVGRLWNKSKELQNTDPWQNTHHPTTKVTVTSPTPTRPADALPDKPPKHHDPPKPPVKLQKRPAKASPTPIYLQRPGFFLYPRLMPERDRKYKNKQRRSHFNKINSKRKPLLPFY